MAVERVYECACLGRYGVEGENADVTVIMETRYIARSAEQAEEWARRRADRILPPRARGRVACICEPIA